jgi:hypothetical protein
MAARPLLQPSRVKIISMGDERVGKSCLIKRFCEEKFVDKYVPTIGIDFGGKPVAVAGCGQVRVNFWDMAGGSEYYAVRSEFYADAQVRPPPAHLPPRRPASGRCKHHHWRGAAATRSRRPCPRLTVSPARRCRSSFPAGRDAGV